MNFVPAYRLGLSALEFFESLDGETDPSLSDLFRVFDRFGKLCGDQCPIFGIELERFFENLFDGPTHCRSVRQVLEDCIRCEIPLPSAEYRPRAPVRVEDFADETARASWREEEGLTVFSLWSPSYPGTEVDLFVEEPFDFGEAWNRRLDAVLDDGTTVHVVGIDDLRALKASVGRPKDLDDIAQLDVIARATLGDDEDAE